MSPGEIRRIKRSDNKILAKIIRNVFEEFDLPLKGTVYSDPTTDHLFELFSTEGAACFVVEFNNEILGCAGIYPTKNLPKGCCEFSKFYLSPNARSRGFGKNLLQLCIEEAKKFGYKMVYIESFHELSTALEMYKKFGFETLEHPLGKSGHDACSIWQVFNIM